MTEKKSRTPNKSAQKLCKAFRSIMETENGKIVFDDYLRGVCFYDNTTFSLETADPITMAYREGMRSVFLSLQALLNDDIKFATGTYRTADKPDSD